MNALPVPMRFAVATAFAAVAAITVTALAQGAPPPPPLEPLPEIAQPPGVAGDPELEPQVTITRKEGEVVEEARVNGRLVWVKVTPRHGRPYFLVPEGGGNTFIRRESLDTGLRVPLWLLLEF